MKKLIAAPGTWKRFWDDTAKAPWIYAPSQSGGTFITFEDTQSLQVKLDYAAAKGLGGLMLWDLSSDVRDASSPYSLVGRIHAALRP